MGLLNERESERFRLLQTKADNKQELSDGEQQEYQELEDRILAQEASYLHPANERLLLEAERLEGQNDTLRQLIVRKQMVATRLRKALADALAEEKAIQRELSAILPDTETAYAPPVA